MKHDNIRQLLGDLEALGPEKRLKVEQAGLPEILEKLFTIYERRVNNLWDNNNIYFPRALSRLCVTSNTIFELALLLPKYEDREYYDYDRFGSNTGDFLTAIIRHSYKTGRGNVISLPLLAAEKRKALESLMGRGKFRECLAELEQLKGFTLYLEHLKKPIGYIGWLMYGRKGNPIRLFITGNIGNSCFLSAKYCHVSVAGNVGEGFANFAKHCYFKIAGSVASAGADALDTIFEVTDKSAAETLKLSVGKKCEIYLLKNDRRVLFAKT